MKKLLQTIAALAFGFYQLNAQAPDLVFSNTYMGPSTSNDYGSSVLTLTNGEIVLSGTSGRINPYYFYQPTATSTFIGKYDEAGVNIWYSPLGGNTMAAQLAKDASGNIYMVGSTQGTIGYFGSTSVSSVGTNTLGSQNIAIAKYSNSGTLLWAKVVGSSGNEYGTGIAVDANGDIYVTGYNNATGPGIIDVEPGNPSASFSIFGASFIVKLSPNGNHMWHKTVSTGGYNYHGVCVDENNVYLATSASGSNVNVNSSGPSYTVATNAGSYDLALIKYRLDGTLVNAKVIGGNTNEDYAKGIEVKNGRLALFGSMRGAGINMNGYLASPSLTISTNGSSTDGFIAVYDTTLLCQWAKPISGISAFENVNGAAFDNTGNVVIAGQYLGTGAQPCNFNVGSAGTFTASSNSATTTDYFYASYNVATGVCNWLYHNGVFTDNDYAADIAVDADGKIWVTGLASGGTASGNNLFLNKHYCASTYTLSLKEDGINLPSSGPNAFAANGCNGQNPIFTAIATPSTNIKYTFYNLSGAASTGSSMTAVTTTTNYSNYGGMILLKDTVTHCEQLFNYTYGFIGSGSVTINPSNTVVCSGSPITLNGSANGGGSITYTWNPGNITPAAGVYTQTFAPTSNTTYTALVNDGTCLWRAFATVSVNPVPIVNATSTSTLVCSGPGNTFSLSALGTATSFTWSTANWGVLGYTQGLNAGAVSTNTFLVTGSNGTCTAQSSIVVVIASCTAVKENEALSSISIFPNPATDVLNIEIQSMSGSARVEVLDLTGKTIISQTMSNTHAIDMSHLSTGIYMVKVICDEKTSVKRIVKQ